MVFQCFSLSSPSPKILQKCSQNCPRTSQVELKMPILALSWPILALSWPILALSWPILAPSWPILAPSWPILDGTCRQLDPNFAHLAPILPQLREKFSPKRAKDPKKRPKSAQDPPQPPIFFDFLPLWILIFIISRSFLDLESTSEPHPDHYRNSSEIRGTVAGVAKHLDIFKIE